MARTARALREDAMRLRESGWTFAAIAKDWAIRHGLNPRVTMRLAHGLTQAEVANRWNDLWPDPVPKTAKHISYWEIWPEPGGRAPSLDTLNRLALIYQCSAGDLLGGEDHTYLDPAARSVLSTPVSAQTGAGTVQVLTVAIAVVRDSAQVLLVCRRDEAGGSWQFPAGVVKPGADPAAVAVAETLAETGVHCRIVAHLGRRLHPVTQVMCEYFLCEYLTGTPDNRDPVENLTVTWVDEAKLTKFIPAEAIFPPVMQALAEAA
ncbi:NUDIX domain-containing protein [Allorhizocola rhizosphaerae]|uniref:NUDIX domain-containing protein n=1 Tax=Allorhizocola rhizosphaerae TaxID=1872709 RepID=UPI001FE8B0D7|nr:NUDIX domain-containing protein [Allorhizocola rhizosphaerae]